MTDLGFSIIFAVLFSILIATIEIISKSKAKFKSCFRGNFFIYLLILIIGNSATTLMASSIIESVIGKGNSIPGPLWFWYAFVGVFGFQVIIQNMNITFFDAGVLSIDDWISKARDTSIADAVAQNDHSILRREQRLARELMSLDLQELNTQISQYLEDGVLQKLEEKAANNKADPKLVKALALAKNRPDEAKAILDERRR